jgi:hypothetical protein
MKIWLAMSGSGAHLYTCHILIEGMMGVKILFPMALV